MIQGLVYFNGIAQIVDGSMSFTTGITPSQATLTIAPQAGFTAQVGTLTFFDGQTTVSWLDARVDTNSFERNSAGLVWRLAIYDRRWKWQSTGGGNVITLYANLRDDTGEIIECTKLSPQEAAVKCLDAMGETDYDIGALPNEERPELLWDCALPAQVLEELCEQFGCRVTLCLDNKVHICKVGTGAALPDTPDIATNSLAVELPGIPDRIGVIGAPDRFQVNVLLEAVGLDRDGTYKPITDLTYITGSLANGSTPDDFDGISDIKDRALALKSVFRCYRVKFPIYVPGYTDTQGNTNARITRPWQVKLEDTQVEYVTDDLGLPESQRRCKPALIYGKYWEEMDGKPGSNISSLDAAPYQSDPMLDAGDDEDATVANRTWHMGSEAQLGRAKDHVVVFDKPIYLTGTTYPYLPAELRLRCACTILDEYTFSPVRTYFYRDTNAGLNTKPRYELFSDLQVYHYWDTSQEPHSVKDNTVAVKKDADYYIDGIYQEYQCTQPQTITYNGLKYIDLDGAIQHVHYKVSKSGCTTTASRNNEQLHRVQPLSYRKLMRKIKQLVRNMQRQRPTLRTHRRGQWE